MLGKFLPKESKKVIYIAFYKTWVVKLAKIIVSNDEYVCNFSCFLSVVRDMLLYSDLREGSCLLINSVFVNLSTFLSFSASNFNKCFLRENFIFVIKEILKFPSSI